MGRFRFPPRGFLGFLCKHRGMSLAFCWLFGLFCGSRISQFLSWPFFSLMHSGLWQPVSIVFQLGIFFLPFLMTAAAVLYSPWLVLLLCFGKAFLFALVSSGLRACFGGFGWLHWLLAMFCSWLCLPGLYFLWLRLLDPLSKCKLGFVLILGGVFSLMSAAAYRITSPVWAAVILFQKG